ncbi:cardiolipin synthase [Sediminicola sp. 1XM1-17]|uniref:cardiolipin synthase n=1 Tax=Sediminicola sp. 1XM1-17 TaxID=3127702 RepID=UPI00307875F9
MISFVRENLWQVLLGINYILVIIFSIIIVLKNSHPVRTLSYLFALAALPFLGLLVYYFFGQDYRKDKIFEKKSVLDSSKLKEWRESFEFTTKENEEFEEEFGEGIFKIYRLLQNNDKAVVTFQNKAEILVNGEKKFKLLLKDLKAAKSHIHLEYFIVVDDELGGQILDILCEKAKEGVEVRLIYDDVGSKITSKVKQKLGDSGVEHHAFMPVIFTKFTSKFNYRDHRKIVVIDGSIGYVGGINLEKKYDNTYDNKVFWRDTHLRLEGDAVGSLQSTFLLNWDFVSKAKIDIKKVIKNPLRETNNTTAVQIVASGPDTDWASIMEAMFSAINSANEYIYITSPYLIPNAEILAALTTASRSGVEVKLIIPKDSDSWAAKYATDSYIEEFLDSGIEVYRYCKGFVHAKTIVIDDCLSSIGTANLDYRSFSINFEVNAMLYDTRISKQMKKIFMQDLKDCEMVDVERWKDRSLSRRLKESFSRLWSPLL